MSILSNKVIDQASEIYSLKTTIAILREQKEKLEARIEELENEETILDDWEVE